MTLKGIRKSWRKKARESERVCVCVRENENESERENEKMKETTNCKHWSQISESPRLWWGWWEAHLSLLHWLNVDSLVVGLSDIDTTLIQYMQVNQFELVVWVVAITNLQLICDGIQSRLTIRLMLCSSYSIDWSNDTYHPSQVFIFRRLVGSKYGTETNVISRWDWQHGGGHFMSWMRRKETVQQKMCLDNDNHNEWHGVRVHGTVRLACNQHFTLTGTEKGQMRPNIFKLFLTWPAEAWAIVTRCQANKLLSIFMFSTPFVCLFVLFLFSAGLSLSLCVCVCVCQRALVCLSALFTSHICSCCCYHLYVIVSFHCMLM